MKFAVLFALFATASALTLTQEQGHQLIKAVHTRQVNNIFAAQRARNQLKAQWEDLTEEQMKEIEEWFVEQLTTGEKTITW